VPGQRQLLPLIPEFLARYSGIEIDIALTDQVVNLVQERTDVAIRHGPLDSSRLMARKLRCFSARARRCRCGSGCFWIIWWRMSGSSSWGDWLQSPSRCHRSADLLEDLADRQP